MGSYSSYFSGLHHSHKTLGGSGKTGPYAESPA